MSDAKKQENKFLKKRTSFRPFFLPAPDRFIRFFCMILLPAQSTDLSGDEEDSRVWKIVAKFVAEIKKAHLREPLIFY